MKEKQIKRLIKESNEMIVSKTRGESWKEANARNEYYKEEGRREMLKKAEQFKKELDELQEAYDIAMKEIARLRAKLYGESKC